MDKVIAILNDKNGKDKSLKLVQYTCKILLHFGSQNPEMAKLASALSLFRAMMRLGNWLEPGYSIKKGVVSGEALAVDTLDFFTAVCDDIICFKKIGIVTDKRVVGIADRQAAVTWLLAILINMKNAWRVYQSKPTRVNMVSFCKLASDGVFCGVDVFEINSDLVQILAGFSSGILAYYKLWIKR